MAGESDGMTTTAGMPSSRAARATPWAWFPEEYVTTPQARAAAESDETTCTRRGS